MHSRAAQGRGTARGGRARLSRPPLLRFRPICQAVERPVPASASASASRAYPQVDWSRYHLQILFVDRSDTVRGKLAAGIFERIAEWNGYGRAMYPWSVGLEAAQRAGERSLGKMAALMNGAAQLGVMPRYIARTAEQFELEDMDRYDLVVTMDQSIHDDILRSVAAEDYYRDHLEHYRSKTCLFTHFSAYETDTRLLAVGGLALLPMQLSFLLRPALSRTKAVVDISTPELSSASGQQQWEEMVAAMILAAAGLCKYLMDMCPDDNGDLDA